MYQVTKEIEWSAAHRLLNYKGKCANIHGHSYRAIFTFEGNTLDENGMVIDFTILKEKIQKWIDENWDHALILSHEDPLLNITKTNKHFIINGNPTAENMAEFLFYYFRTEFTRISLISVEVFEGLKSSAIYTEK